MVVPNDVNINLWYKKNIPKTQSLVRILEFSAHVKKDKMHLSNTIGEKLDGGETAVHSILIKYTINQLSQQYFTSYPSLEILIWPSSQLLDYPAHA